MEAVDVLLSANANPLTTMTENLYVKIFLDAAVASGHVDVVYELVRQFGIEGCGGVSGGVDALRRASLGAHLDVMDMLTDAGVVDTGKALVTAATHGIERSLAFLLKKWQEDEQSHGGVGYVNNTFGFSGKIPLLCAINLKNDNVVNAWLGYRRIARRLIDAGADTTSAVRLTGTITTATGELLSRSYTPLDFAIAGAGEYATEEELEILADTRRLLLRVPAVHAVSWLWPSDTPTIADAVEGTITSKRTSTPFKITSPILRRKAGSRRMLLATLGR